jgi:hypothetical protein
MHKSFAMGNKDTMNSTINYSTSKEDSLILLVDTKTSMKRNSASTGMESCSPRAISALDINYPGMEYVT